MKQILYVWFKCLHSSSSQGCIWDYPPLNFLLSAFSNPMKSETSQECHIPRSTSLSDQNQMEVEECHSFVVFESFRDCNQIHTGIYSYSYPSSFCSSYYFWWTKNDKNFYFIEEQLIKRLCLSCRYNSYKKTPRSFSLKFYPWRHMYT